MSKFAKSGWIGNSYFLIVKENQRYIASVTTAERTYNTECPHMKKAMEWVETTINRFRNINYETDRHY